MKNKKVIVTIVIVAIGIIIALIFLLGKEGKNGYGEPTEHTEMDNNEKFNDSLIQEANTGEIALKNTCGLFGEQLKEIFVQGRYEILYSMLNQEVLSKYGYSSNKDAYMAYWTAFGEPFVGHEIRSVIFRTTRSNLNGGVLASYCVVVSLPDSVERECYDYGSSRWLNITLYFDDQGKVTSLIPCPEAAIDSYAKTLGFEKGGK